MSQQCDNSAVIPSLDSAATATASAGVSVRQHVSQYVTHEPVSSPPSVRYIDELCHLDCTPDLFEMSLFPDSKEITESMAAFHALRKVLGISSLPQGNIASSDSQDTSSAAKIAPHKFPPNSDISTRDAIVVVGDGCTPRTAALCAYRLHHLGWYCYSVDPMMNVEVGSKVRGLISIRSIIETVRIYCRRVVVVMMHTHVALEVAIKSIHAQEIAGVVCVPCCNWFNRQMYLTDNLLESTETRTTPSTTASTSRQADVVYDDMGMLTLKREVRVWIGRGASSQSARESLQQALELHQHTNMLFNDPTMKLKRLCTPSEFKAAVERQYALSTNSNHTPLPPSTAVTTAWMTKMDVSTVGDLMVGHETACTRLSANNVLQLLQQCASGTDSILLLGFGQDRHQDLLSTLASNGYHNITYSIQQPQAAEKHDVVIDLGAVHFHMLQSRSKHRQRQCHLLMDIVRTAVKSDGVVVVVSPSKCLRRKSMLSANRFNWSVQVTSFVIKKPTTAPPTTAAHGSENFPLFGFTCTSSPERIINKINKNQSENGNRDKLTASLLTYTDTTMLSSLQQLVSTYIERVLPGGQHDGKAFAVNEQVHVVATVIKMRKLAAEAVFIELDGNVGSGWKLVDQQLPEQQQQHLPVSISACADEFCVQTLVSSGCVVRGSDMQLSELLHDIRVGDRLAITARPGVSKSGRFLLYCDDIGVVELRSEGPQLTHYY